MAKKSINNPLVSIIIPVFNGEKYVKEAIDSALAQTYENIEIVVINDGSTDNTEKVCKNYGDKIVYFSQENKGVSHALNIGIEKMNGEYFSWLSHDDLYYPNKVQQQIEVLRSYDFEYKIISNRANLVNEQGNIIRRRKSKNRHKTILGTTFYKRNLIKNPSGIAMMIHKDVFNEVGLFNTKYKYIQDFDLWQKIALFDFRIIISQNTLAATRVHGEQQTMKIPELLPLEIYELMQNQLDIIKRKSNANEIFPAWFMFLGISNNRFYYNNKEYLKLQINKLTIISRIKLKLNYYFGKTIFLLKKINRKLLNRNRK